MTEPTEDMRTEARKWYGEVMRESEGVTITFDVEEVFAQGIAHAAALIESHLRREMPYGRTFAASQVESGDWLKARGND